MEADLERILVDSIQLETENITLKQLVRFYNGKPDMQDQLKNMLHYNQQVTFYIITFFILFCWIQPKMTDLFRSCCVQKRFDGS